MVDDFGWYYEESYARTGHSSQWAAIQDACEDMLDGDDNRTILVGPMRKLAVRDFLSIDDLKELAEEERLSGDEIVELIASRMYDEVGGCDYGARMSTAQKLELRSMIAGGCDYQSILDFVTTYTELESDSVCDGVDPFPIQYAEGKWHWGRNLDNPDAEIEFNAHAGVDDRPLGFTWVVSDEDGFSGEGVATLTEAMAQAEAAVTRHRTSVSLPPSFQVTDGTRVFTVRGTLRRAVETIEITFSTAPSCAPTYALSHRWGWPDENGVMRCACGVTDLEDDIAHAVPCRIYAVAIEAGHSGPVSVEVLGLWADDYNLTQLDPVEAERQRCERLGVVWVGPDVQEVLHGPQLAERDAAGMLNRERLAASRDIVRLGCELREADGVRAR